MYFRLSDGVQESRNATIKAIRNGNPEVMAVDELAAAGRMLTPATPTHDSRYQVAPWVPASQTFVVSDKTLASVQADMVERTNDLAGQKIIAIMPEWKQSNLNMRANELNWLKGAGTITPAEEAEAVALIAVANDDIKPIRAASDVIVIAINAAMTPAAAVAAFDAGVWPD
jgi:hypothetical protein